MDAATKPDWSRWGQCHEVTAWEGLALSVDVEPATLGTDHFLALQGQAFSQASDPEWLRSMAKRWVALVSAVPLSKACPSRADDIFSLNSRLLLSDLVAWQLARKWKLPKALRDMAPAATVPPASKPANKPAKAAAKKPAASKKLAPKQAAKTSTGRAKRKKG